MSCHAATIAATFAAARAGQSRRRRLQTSFAAAENRNEPPFVARLHDALENGRHCG
jgi:hypothetical protein